MEETINEKLTTQQEKFTWIERIGGMIISPKITFRYIIDNPDWLFPLFIMLAGGLISGLASVCMFCKGSAFLFITSIFGIIGIVLVFWIIWVIKTGIIYLLAMAFGGRESFYKLLCLVGYAHIPLFLKEIISGSIALFTSGEIYSQFGVLFSLAKLFPGLDFQNPLCILLFNIEIFIFWNLILCVLGLSLLFKFSYKKSLLIVAIYWSLSVGVQILFLLIGKMFQEMATQMNF